MKASSNFSKFMAQNRSKILTGVGVAGMWGASVWAVCRTVKATRAVDAEKERLGVDKLTPKQIIKIGWKYYVVPFSVAIASTSAIVVSDVDQEKRVNTLQAGLALAEASKEKLLEETKKQIGEEATKVIEDQVRKEIVEDNKDHYDVSDIATTNHGEILFYEPQSDKFFRSSHAAVAEAFTRLKDEIANGNAALNDWRNFLDLDYCRIGWELGLDEGDLKNLSLDIEHYTVSCPATGEAAIVVEIGVDFHADYVHRYG